MEYTKQNFIDGQILNAEQLNHIEEGILALVDAVKALENSGSTGTTSSPIKYVESTDTSNLLNLRDFESGTYVLYGKFHPFSGSTASISFSNALLVNIITKTAGTHVQVFYPVNNCVQFLSITDDSYERTNIYLNDLLTAVGTLSNLTTTDKTSLVSAINELKTYVDDTVSLEYAQSIFAPAGYGLGGRAVSIDSLNNAKEFGLYISNKDAPSDADWTCLAMPDTSGNIAQIASRCVAEQVFYATRASMSGTWGEWELLNPYMAVGTEYKTTEKYKGKPVYKKLIEYTNTETIGSDGTITNIAIPHGISNFGELVSITAKQKDSVLPYLTSSGKLAVVSTVSANSIFVDTNASWTSRKWEFEVAYTKAN